MNNSADNDDDSAPGIQTPSDDDIIESVRNDNGEPVNLHSSMLIPLTKDTEDLPDSMYMTVLEDDDNVVFFL